MAGMLEAVRQGGARYRTLGFELDVRRLLLLHQGQAVDIEPKPLEVLAELLAHAGDLVTKAELMDSVWYPNGLN